ncbi:MAG: hypothetical protein IJ757_04845 [Clostridiales bacterium]|nr:hypothetical protein [Clostridiales bacterium]
MDKNENAYKLLRALGEVDEKYIEESMVEPKAVKVTPLNHRSIIALRWAAAAVVLITSSLLLLKIFVTDTSKTVNTSNDHAMMQEEAAAINDDAYSGAVSDSNNSYGAAENSYDAAPEEDYLVIETAAEGSVAETTAATAAAEEATDNGEAGAPSDVQDRSVDRIDVDSIDELVNMAGFEFIVPDEVNGSSERQYGFYENGIAEVTYLDVSGETICTVRKGPENVNVFVNDCCFSQARKIDIEDGPQNVLISGNGQTWQLAIWSYNGNSYAVTTVAVDMDTMTNIVAAVS